jgi:hypothetical protein
MQVHCDADWDYSFWRPHEWKRYDMQEQYGFIYSPVNDPRTGFYVSVQDLSDILDDPVSEEDLPALHEGVMDGLRGLPDCQILEEKEIAKGFALGFEVTLTFTQDGETFKRRMRLLYNDRQQFAIYGQGVPAAVYDAFQDTYEYMYHTFAFGNVLALAGVPGFVHSSVEWEGGGEGVQTKPNVPRDHSDWLKKKRQEAGLQDDDESS